MKKLLEGIVVGAVLDMALRAAAEPLPVLKHNVLDPLFKVLEKSGKVASEEAGVVGKLQPGDILDLHLDDAIVLGFAAFYALKDVKFGCGIILGHIIASYTPLGWKFAKSIGQKIGGK